MLYNATYPSFMPNREMPCQFFSCVHTRFSIFFIFLCYYIYKFFSFTFFELSWSRRKLRSFEREKEKKNSLLWKDGIGIWCFFLFYFSYFFLDPFIPVPPTFGSFLYLRYKYNNIWNRPVVHVFLYLFVRLNRFWCGNWIQLRRIVTSIFWPKLVRPHLCLFFSNN